MSTIADTEAVSARPAADAVSGDGSAAAGNPTALDSVVRDQLVETREEIGRVDQKASIILAGASVAVSAILVGLIAGDLNPVELPVAVLVLGGISAALALAGIALLASAIYPQCGHPVAGRARYFAEVAAYETIDEVRVALALDAATGDRLLHQLLGLSKVVSKKYVRLRWGIKVLGVAIALACGAGGLDLLLG